MRELLGTIAILAIIAGIVLFANGWLTVNKGPQSTTIEVKTHEIKQATEHAVEQGKEFIEESTSPTPKPVVTPVAPEANGPLPTDPLTPPNRPLPAPTTAEDLYSNPSRL